MIREIVKIDRDKCNGCGICIPSCHEGALQMIDNKATLVSELMCDGLGACLGHCPEDAITIERREAPPYDEVTVIKEMIPHGKNVITAHLLHLKDHGQTEFLNQGIEYLKTQKTTLAFNLDEILGKLQTPVEPRKEAPSNAHMHAHHHGGGGCPGSQTRSFAPKQELNIAELAVEQASELRQWPVQMHLINPMAPYFKNADLVLAADCVAYSIGNFHSGYLKGKSLAIACPKLDSHTEVYIQKLTALIDNAQINTLQVMVMEVPCCRGLLQMAQMAAQAATRKVPIKLTMVGVQGEIQAEQWV